jgi:FixJ family two-component response regulator
VALSIDKEYVPKAVSVEAALEIEIVLPVLRGDEVADPLREFGNEFRVVVLKGHF